jgi:predicted DNA-binding transcriptional regulator YafY
MFDNSLVGVVIDRFGKSVIIRKVDENNFTAALKVEVRPTFFAWIFQFGTKVKILSTDAVREKFIQYAEDVAAAYK